MNKKIKYKEIEILRKKNILYLGKFSDPYIIMMQILDSEYINNINISKKISIQLHDNNNQRTPIIRKTEKYNLLDAIEIGYIWLSRINNKNYF